MTEVKRWLHNCPSCIYLTAVLAATTFHRRHIRAYYKYHTRYFSETYIIQRWSKHLRCLEISSSICHLFIVVASRFNISNPLYKGTKLWHEISICVITLSIFQSWFDWNIFHTDSVTRHLTKVGNTKYIYQYQ